MTCDLEQIYGPFADTFPTVADGNHYILLSKKNLPLPLERISTRKLIIKSVKHSYNDYYQSDLLWFQGTKQTYKQLAILICAVVFHPKLKSVHIDITHPASNIKHLIVEIPATTKYYPGYQTQPHRFCYYPNIASSYMDSPCKIHIDDLPCFYLTSWQKSPITDEEWKERDTVCGFGNDRGNITIAELLLNASLPQNTTTEYRLESTAGNGGVGRLSAEANFFLPGSFGFIDLE